jgi:hypothetical protein
MTDATFPSGAAERSGILGRLPKIDPASPALTWAGLVVAGLGFAIIAFSWGKVSELLQVSLQLPYVVSGGFTGVALVVVGMTAVNVAARKQDAAQRAQQMAELQGVLRELRETLDR